MVIDVNLDLKNENEEIHRPVPLRTLELTVKKRKSIGCAKKPGMGKNSAMVVVLVGRYDVACLVLVSTGEFRW